MTDASIHRIAVAVVFAWALMLRLWLLPTARFGGDEAYFFNTSLDILHSHGIPLLGSPITDGSARLLGPGFFLWMTIPLFLSPTPEAQYAWIEFGGAVTVVVWMAAVRMAFTAAHGERIAERASWCAGLFAASMPWAVLMSDRTWNPNVLPLAVATLLWMIARIRLHAQTYTQTQTQTQSQSRCVVFVLPLLALMTHLHLSCVVVLPATACLLWRRVRLRPVMVLMTTTLTLLVWMPMMVSEVSTGGANLQALWRETVMQQGGERQAWSFLWVPVYALRMLTTDATYHELRGYWGGPSEWACLRALWFGIDDSVHPIRFAGFMTSLGVALLGVWSMWRSSSLRAWRWAIFLTVAMNTLLIAVTAKPVFGHYVHLQFWWLGFAWAAGFVHVVGVLQGTRKRLVLAFACAATSMVSGAATSVRISREVDGPLGLGTYADVASLAAQQPAPVMIHAQGMYHSSLAWRVYIERVARLRWGQPGTRMLLKPAGKSTKDHTSLPFVDVEITQP
jgi:hypothetical protein